MKKRIFLSIILVLAMVFSTLPQFGLTAFATSDASTIDVSDGTSSSLPDGVTYDSDNNLFTIDTRANDSTINVESTTATNTMVVADGVTGLTLVLNGVSITSTAQSPIDLQGTANVTIQLADGTTSTLDASGGTFIAGLRVPSSASLAINGDTGSLNAIGGNWAAGIGGSSDANSDDGAGGTITINGGAVTARGGYLGAGIGGGDNAPTGGTGGTITIEGGTVTAIGGYLAAGIGGGGGGEGTDIGGTGGTIKIEGGAAVNATGGTYGAGIGGGGVYSGTGGAGGDITIDGGATVNAAGGTYGAGIGGGGNESGTGGAGGTINISGGDVTAYGGANAAGIGGGYGGAAGIIDITGSPIIMAAAQTPASADPNFRNAIDVAGGSSGTVINAVLDSAISTSDTTYLECDGNVLALPAGYQCFAFSAAAASAITAYSDAGCTTPLGNIVTNPGGADSIPIIDLSLNSTAVTPVRVSTEVTTTCDGSGTPEDPYIITSAAQLNELRNYLGSENADLYWKLGNDIDLSSYNGGSWVPIDVGENTFDGHVDGGGHKLTGLQITGENDYSGLFNMLNGEIKNLGVVLGPNGVNGGNYVGGIAGYLGTNGTLDGCYVTGNVSGYNYIGGLVGSAYGDIICSHTAGSVSGTDNFVGGLAGAASGDIASCYATCDVSGSTGVGGLLGASDPDAAEFAHANFYGCYASGDVSGSRAVGGLVGAAYGSIFSSYATGSVSDSGDYAGGLAGMFFGDISYCYAAGSVSGNGANVGGLAGAESTGPMTSCYYDSTINSEIQGVGSTTIYDSNAVGKSTADMMKKSTFTGWNFENIWGIHEGSSYPYFRIHDAGLTGVAGQRDSSPAGGDGSSAVTPVTWSVSVANTKASLTLADIEAASGATFILYSNAGFTTEKTNLALTAGGSTTAYIKVTARDIATVKYYTVSINRAGDVSPSPTGNGGHGGSAPARTITVTETSSSLFSRSAGSIQAKADMNDAFFNSIEVKVTDTDENKANFGFGAGGNVYPFDISLYIKGTNEKTQPAAGYTVTIYLPVPENLLDKKDLLSIVHKSDDGIVTTLSSRLTQINGVWYLTFEATEFSPYALVVRNAGAYDESAGVPYYLDANGNKAFIGFAANGKYIAPEGMPVSVMHNSKSFTDVSGHWAAGYIGFVTEREVFLGTGGDTFSPDAGMTRAMFATVIGRLYEHSYGEIKPSATHAFTDCDYGAYYGKYIDWATANNIIGGYGNGRFGPNDKITREQMAAILYRFANFLGALPGGMNTVLTYPDSASISDYAKTAALYCQTTGVIGGRTGGMFAPQETATRAEVATIIQRFVETVVK